MRVLLYLVVDCGPLSDPDNGQVDTSNGTTFGNTATYTCHKESGSRTCGVDGLWTSTEPNCQETGKIFRTKYQQLFIGSSILGRHNFEHFKWVRALSIM